MTNNIVPINAHIEPIIFFKSVDSFNINIASIIVNIGPELCIILLTEAVVYFIPVFCKIPGRIIVNNPMPRYINRSFFGILKLFFLCFRKRKMSIGMKTVDLIAARVIGGTPLFNTILISGKEKDHINTAESTMIK